MAKKRMNLVPAPKGLHCRKYLSLDGSVRTLTKEIKLMSDPRTGKNIQYEVSDSILSAFAMFSLKDPSLLQFQEHFSKDENLKNIYKIKNLPSDTQMRRVLDELDSKELDVLFPALFSKIQRGKVLKRYVGINGTYTVAVDGVHYFKSKKKTNDRCTVKNHSNGEVSYNLSSLGAAIVNPGCKTVIPLCPEAIVKQDGEKKNDCEVVACVRLLEKLNKLYSKLKITYLMDAMFSNATVINKVLETGDNYIMGIKPDSHKYLYNQIEQCESYNIKLNGITHKFRYCNDVSLNASNLELKTNVIFYEEHSTDGVKKFSWVTSHKIDRKNIMQIMESGRARWKIENETFNTLKNQGYNLEHCYGLGKKNLSVNFMKIMMLAFLVDQIQQTCCRLFQAALSRLGAKIKVWDDIKAYIKCFVINSMEDVFKIIVYGIQKQSFQFQT